MGFEGGGTRTISATNNWYWRLRLLHPSHCFLSLSLAVAGLALPYTVRVRMKWEGKLSLFLLSIQHSFHELLLLLWKWYQTVRIRCSNSLVCVCRNLVMNINSKSVNNNMKAVWFCLSLVPSVEVENIALRVVVPNWRLVVQLQDALHVLGLEPIHDAVVIAHRLSWNTF